MLFFVLVQFEMLQIQNNNEKEIPLFCTKFQINFHQQMLHETGENFMQRYIQHQALNTKQIYINNFHYTKIDLKVYLKFIKLYYCCFIYNNAVYKIFSTEAKIKCQQLKRKKLHLKFKIFYDFSSKIRRNQVVLPLMFENLFYILKTLIIHNLIHRICMFIKKDEKSARLPYLFIRLIMSKKKFKFYYNYKYIII